MSKKKVQIDVPISINKVHSNIISIFYTLQSIRDIIDSTCRYIQNNKVSPVEQNTDKKIISSLKESIKKYNEIVPLFRSIENVDKTLMSIIKYSMPIALNEVEVDGLCDTSLTDLGFASEICCILRNKNNSEKCDNLLILAKKITNGIEDLKRKKEKFNERIKLSTREDKQTPEYSVVLRKRNSVDIAIDVLNKRFEMIIDKFLEIRKHTIQEVVNYTQNLQKIFDTNGDRTLVDIMMKYDIRNDLGSILAMDGKQIIGNYKDKKGRKALWPTM